MPATDQQSALACHAMAPPKRRAILPRSFRCNRPPTPVVWSMFLWCSLCLLAPTAEAQPRAVGSEQAHCRYLQEQARAEAIPLQSPELVVQAMRFPDAFGVEGTTWGEGFQGRVGLAYSPSDLVKGIELRNLGEARCNAHQLETRVAIGLDLVLNQARSVALAARLAFLDQEKAAWQEVQRRTERRLAEQLITRNEAVEVRRRVHALEGQLLDTEAEVALLAARRVGNEEERNIAAVTSLVQQYVDAQLKAEEAQSNVRKMSAWQLRVAGGIIPTPSDVNWYSIAELRLNLGAPQQYQHLARAEEAKKAALQESTRELPARLSRVRAEARTVSQQSQKRLALIDQQLSNIESDLSTLTNAEHEAAGQLKDSLQLERIAANAERVSLQNLITTLSPLVQGEQQHE